MPRPDSARATRRAGKLATRRPACLGPFSRRKAVLGPPKGPAGRAVATYLLQTWCSSEVRRAGGQARAGERRALFGESQRRREVCWRARAVSRLVQRSGGEDGSDARARGRAFQIAFGIGSLNPSFCTGDALFWSRKHFTLTPYSAGAITGASDVLWLGVRARERECETRARLASLTAPLTAPA